MGELGDKIVRRKMFPSLILAPFSLVVLKRKMLEKPKPIQSGEIQFLVAGQARGTSIPHSGPFSVGDLITEPIQ